MELIGLIAVIVIGLILYMIKEAFQNRVVQNVLDFPDFPDSFGEVNIFFISDIHRRKITDHLIKKINKKVDLVIIGGDLTEKGVPFSRVEQNLKALKKLGPVYFVWGNNDYEVDYHELDALLLSQGVKILDNTAAMFESYEGEKLLILGIDDLNVKRDKLENALLDAGDEGFKILVSHDPRVTSKISKSHNIQLVLAGHTHGGQINFFGLSPYEKGKVKKLEQTTLLISNGFGTTAVPMRFGAKAETNLIILRKSK
jgi:uncharacterized protein